MTGDLTRLLSATALLLGSQAAFTQSPMTQAELVRHLKNYEQAIRTCRATMDVDTRPTRPEMISKIRAVLTGKGIENQLPSFIHTESETRRKSKRIVWIRSGIKERFDRQNRSADNQAVSTIAYDGLVVRSVSKSDSEVRATIRTPESIGWGNTNSISPYTLTSHLYGTPFSEWLEKSQSVKIDVIDWQGNMRHRAMFEMAGMRDRSVVMFFDENLVQIERRYYGRFGHTKDTAPRLFHVYHLENPVRHDVGDGRTIVFPGKVRVQYAIDESPNGEPVYTTEDVVTIKEIAFNAIIQDSEFEPHVPPGVVIRDEITGVGTVPPPDPVRLWKDGPPRPPRRFDGWLWFVAGGAVVAAFAGWLLWRRVRHSRGV